MKQLGIIDADASVHFLVKFVDVNGEGCAACVDSITAELPWKQKEIRKKNKELRLELDVVPCLMEVNASSSCLPQQ